MKMEEHICERLGFFMRHGYIDRLPTPWQVAVGWVVMLPITLSESDRERERSRHTLMGQIPVRVPLQILYNPRQLIVDTGITQEPEYIVRHVISVYHEDAFLGYDLQLLQSHPRGLEILREEARKVVEGRTIWSSYLRKLVGWPGYHEGLIRLADAAERFEYPDPLDLDQRFTSLVGFSKYCCSLPTWPEDGFYDFEFERFRSLWK